MFAATVIATLDSATGEMGVFASAEFEELVKAEEYCKLEAHGVPNSKWTITAELAVQKAVNVVKASRNRNIGIYLQAPGCPPAFQYLKAPLTCTALESLYRGRTVPVKVDSLNLFVGGPDFEVSEL